MFLSRVVFRNSNPVILQIIGCSVLWGTSKNSDETNKTNGLFSRSSSWTYFNTQNPVMFLLKGFFHLVDN